jgi:alanyl-tRNA synthetase
VLRRVIRRAVQQAQRIGLHDVHRLSGVVAEQMADAYPELPERADAIEAVVRTEEERFLETLERGLKLFEELASGDTITGEEAFTLAATYGFPLELTVELAEERGQAVDVDGYHVEMEQHREVSRAGGASELDRAADFARARRTSRASSSATRRPTSSPRSARSSRSTTAISSQSSASRPSIRRAAAR